MESYPINYQYQPYDANGTVPAVPAPNYQGLNGELVQQPPSIFSRAMKIMGALCIVAMIIICIYRIYANVAARSAADEASPSDEDILKEIEPDFIDGFNEIMLEWNGAGCTTKSIPQELISNKTKADRVAKMAAYAASDDPGFQKICYGAARPSYTLGSSQWKYSTDGNDLDCMNNWDLRSSQGAILSKSIKKLTTAQNSNNDTVSWCATTSQLAPSTRIKPTTLSLSERVADIAQSNQTMLIDVAVNAKFITAMMKRIAPKAFARVAARVNLRVQAKAITALVKGIGRNPALLRILETKLAVAIGKSTGVKTIAKVGAKLFSKLMGSAVAKTMVSASAQMAAKVSALAASGPVGWGILMAQSVMMILDLTDAGGYGAMQTKSAYLKFKEKADKEFKDELIVPLEQYFLENPELGAFDPASVEWPQIFDPTAAKTEEDLQKELTTRLNKMLDPDTVPIDPVAKNYFDAIKSDLTSGKIKEADLEDDAIVQTYIDMIDIDTIITQIKSNWCTEAGGLILDGDKCTLPESKCNSQYSWPLTDTDTYTEFRDGKCLVANPAMRTMCAENKLQYNSKTGICDVSEEYCKSKGAEYQFNKKINDYDCKVPVEQAVFEAVFGTTLIRGLKQVFDAAQYEDCGLNNEIKVSSGKCIDVPGGDMNNRLQIYDCNGTRPQKFFVHSRDSSIRTVLNYNKCFEMDDDGYIRFADCRRDRYQIGGAEGADWKYTSFANDPECLNNWDLYDKNGTTLIKGNIENITTERDIKSWCPIDTAKTGRQKFDYSKSLNKIYLKKDRKKVIDLDGDMNANGTRIRVKDRNDDSKSQIFNMPNNKTVSAGLTCDIKTPSRVADCPSTYTNNGANCGRGDDSKSSSAGKGPYETASCPDGYYNNATSCWRDYHSFTRDSFNCVGQKCTDRCTQAYKSDGDPWPCNKDDAHARIYPSCHSQAKKEGRRFWNEYSSGGAFCALPHKSISFEDHAKCPADYPKRIKALCYVDCAAKYGPGYYNNGTSCWRDPSVMLGFGEMTCSPGEFKSGARCYQECPPGYSNTGEFCHRNKQRVIDFSKK
jgi:hypothetical protein